MKVAIIGAGELGVALSSVLKDHTPALWDLDGSKVPGMLSLAETVKDAEVIFCAVPSFGMRQAIMSLAPHIDSKKTIVISLAKGIEKTSRKFMDRLLVEFLPSGQSGVLGGPMLASELGAGIECIGALGFSDPSTAAESQDAIEALFSGANLRIESSDDAHGIAIAGVLKNIYAVLMGVGAGFKLGEDETGWLASRAMEEMVAIGTHLGAQEATITGTAGFADFLATAYSAASRNRATGVALARDGLPAIKGEGILSLPTLIDLLGSLAQKITLLTALEKIVIKKENSEDLFRDIFRKK